MLMLCPAVMPAVGVLEGSIKTSLVHMSAGEMGDMLVTLKGVGGVGPWDLNCW